MFLIGGFALGVLLVVLALVLNSVIYTGALATADGNSEDGQATAEYYHATVDDVRSLLAHANRAHNASHAALYENLSTDVQRIDELANRQYAAEGTAVTTTLLGVTNVTHLGQHTTRTFTDRDGTENWTVATDVSAIRTYRLNVTQDSLPDDDGSCASASDCFTVIVENDTARWQFSVNASEDDDVTVTVVDADGNATTCTATGERATLDVTAGTLAGQSCPALNVTAALDPPYDVTYRYGTLAEGTYDLVVEGTVPEDPHFADAGQPFAKPSIAAATVRLSSQSGNVAFETTTTVTGGEGDA